MSQKSGKKLRKRADNELKMSSPGNDMQEDNVENGVENGHKEVVEETELNGTSEITVQITEEVIIEQRVDKEVVIETREEKICQNVTDENTATPTDNEIEKIGESQESAEVKIDDVNETNAESEIEPLLVETEETEPELEFENSDIDSRKSSPVIRCRTRRSQTRNAPTPNTPKTTEADDIVSECLDKPFIFTAPTPEVTDTESEVSVFKPVTDIGSEKLIEKDINDDFDSMQNISTKAVAGGDTTRNIDFSTYPDEEFEMSPFLTESRDRSIADTLKHLSGRRSIRTSRDYGLLQGGMKRKVHSDSPDYTKRFKTDTSPYVFSYIYNLKDRLTKPEIPSSTPKLTSYKSKAQFDNTNVSKITLSENESTSDKKWCAIM